MSTVNVRAHVKACSGEPEIKDYSEYKLSISHLLTHCLNLPSSKYNLLINERFDDINVLLDNNILTDTTWLLNFIDGYRRLKAVTIL